MASSQQDDEKNLQPTLAGCLLTVLSLAVLGGLALLAVRWREPDSDEPLDKEIVVLLVILGWALFYGIGSAILTSLGLPIFKPKKAQSGREDLTGGP